MTFGISSLSSEIPSASVPTEIRLLPAGLFRSWDGRPKEVGAWNLTEAGARNIISAAASRTSDLVIDYEHATLSASQSGSKAPAAGWWKSMEWRPDGLYATDIKWTEAAARMIQAGEKRYISPVFAWDKRTGEVAAIRMAALVNDPGLDGLTDLARLSADYDSHPGPALGAEFIVPRGYRLDSSRLGLHCAALTHQQAHPSSSYLEALSAVRRDEEAAPGNAGFAIPRSYAVDEARLQLHRSARSWQAANPGMGYEEAVLAAIRAPVSPAS